MILKVTTSSEAFPQCLSCFIALKLIWLVRILASYVTSDYSKQTSTDNTRGSSRDEFNDSVYLLTILPSKVFARPGVVLAYLPEKYLREYICRGSRISPGIFPYWLHKRLAVSFLDIQPCTILLMRYFTGHETQPQLLCNISYMYMTQTR